MKIAIVGSFDSYAHMGVWVADAFEANGYEVHRIDRNEAYKAYGQGMDIIFYIDCSEDFSPHIKLDDTIIVFWSMDAHMPGGIERSVNIARKCDLVFSSNYEYGVKLLEKFGIESYLMPITYKDSLNDFNYSQKELDCVMIGHPNSPERTKLWEILEDYNSFTGIAKDELTYLETMGNARIIVNQPTEPWDMILNNRLFEGLGARALVLQKRLKTELIKKLGFEQNKDFIYWNDFDELKKLLDKYTNREDNDIRYEIGKISQSGHQKVKKYSMNRQAEKIMSIVLSKFYDQL